MSSFDLINLMTLIKNLPLNFDVAFYNWLKILPLTIIQSKSSSLMHYFKLPKLEFKQLIEDITIDI